MRGSSLNEIPVCISILGRCALRLPCGAYNLTHAHYDSLNRIACGGGELISTLSKDRKEKPEQGKLSLKCSKNVFTSIRNRLHGKISGYSTEAEDKIISIAKEGRYSFVWLDQFTYGSTVRKLKREIPSLPVFVFYHTVATPFITRMRHMPLTLRYMPFILEYPLRIWDEILRRNNEKLSAQNSDANIILNDRDGSLFKKRYGFEADMTLPICLADKAHIAPVRQSSDEFNMLFVGGALHRPNLDGIRWFVVNVMPRLDSCAVLYLAGSTIDLLRNDKDFSGNDRIRILGRVENLDDIYNMTDLVIAPIFFGGGMMTKVAEALMYGKHFLATTHALNGYEGLDDYRCDTADEFAEKINRLIASGTERYIPELRKIYDEKYSLDAMTEMLRKFLSDRNII